MQEELILMDKLEDELIDHPDASTRRDLRDTSLDETFQKKLHVRAEQIRSNQADSKRFRKDANGNKLPSQDNFGGVNYQFLINKSHLVYDYKDLLSLEVEIGEWFTYGDVKSLVENEEQRRRWHNEGSAPKNAQECNSLISKEALSLAISNLSSPLESSSITDSLRLLIYFAFGEYGSKESKIHQLGQIKINNHVLISLGMIPAIIKTLETFFEHQKQSDKDGRPIDTEAPLFSNYFKVLTLFYIAVNVILQTDSNDDLLDLLAESEILPNIIKFIEHWKWYPNNSYRVRYLILLCWKLILLEMGDTEQVKKCNDFLVQKHQIHNKAGKDLPKNKLTCSPLDYFTFREDICDKYPLYNEPELKMYNYEAFKKNQENEEKELKAKKKLEENIDSEVNDSMANLNDSMNDLSITNCGQEQEGSDNASTSSTASIDSKYNFFMAVNTYSNSLSNMIESPRTYKSHTVLSQLPTQTVHIATPVPSPTLTASNYMSGGEKIRRSYQVNQAMPLIYPNDGETAVPYAIEEADKILRGSIYESLSTKRLWNERMKFMRQERGFLDEYKEREEAKKQKEDVFPNIDEFDYDETLGSEDQNDNSSLSRSILRVERFYKLTLPHLHTFIQVLIETLKSNKLDYNLNYAELELNPETSYLNTTALPNQAEVEAKIRYVLMLQLEVIRIKEITLKASTSIILLLLKWFKTNHVLKYYYLTSLLFDQQYFTISLEYLSRSFNNVNLQSDRKDDDEYETMINQNQLMNPQVELPEFDFFNNCLGQFPRIFHYDFINKTYINTLPKTVDEQYVSHIDIKNYNVNFCTILANILQTMNKILLKNITQRIFTINDLKLSELYKMILMNYDNESLTKPILKTLKKLVPYQGRKWKSTNMDLISQIYLKLKLSLKDNWLTGKDLESDINNSYDQEIALRALLQFYNLRKYRGEMESIGYGIEDIPNLDLDD